MNHARGRWRFLLGLGAALCCLLLALPAGAAPFAYMDLEIKRQDQPRELHRLRLAQQGDMGQYLLTAGSPPSPKVGGFLLTRNAGQTWYAIDPMQGRCAQWTSQDVAAVLAGLVSRLQHWANLKMDKPSFSKLGQEPGEVISGHPTTHYSFEARFEFKARVLFDRWDYRVTRRIELWATPDLPAYQLRDWLVEAPLRTGHYELDRMISQGLSSVKGLVLKKRVTQAVIDKHGKTTQSEMIQTVTELGDGPAPLVFAPAWQPPPCRPQTREELSKVIKALLKGE